MYAPLGLGDGCGLCITRGMVVGVLGMWREGGGEGYPGDEGEGSAMIYHHHGSFSSLLSIASASLSPR